MNIGKAAESSGVSTKMIRYYESRGLIRPAQRTASGYRSYSPEDIHTLRFIRRARDLGFLVDDIAGLLALWHDRDRASADVRRIAANHIAELDDKIGQLQAMRDTLGELVAHCHGDERPDCPILADLAPAKSDIGDGTREQPRKPTRVE